MPPTPHFLFFPMSGNTLKNVYCWSPNAGKILPAIFENFNFQPPRDPFPPFSVFPKLLPTTSHLSQNNPNPPPIVSNFHPRTCPESNRAPPFTPLHIVDILFIVSVWRKHIFYVKKTYFLCKEDIVLCEEDVFSVWRSHISVWRRHISVWRQIFYVKKTYFLCEEDTFLCEEDIFSFEEDTFSFEKQDCFSPKIHRRPRPDTLGNSRAGETWAKP